MPSGGGMKPSTAVSGGHISPQWGWYISTTPPPLEKYSDPKHAKNKLKQKIGTNADLKISEVPASFTKFSSNPSMPVFKKTLNGQGRTHMDWSSIPL